MKYVYSVAYGFMVGAGIFLVVSGRELMGIITISLGIICLCSNAFASKGTFIKLILSGITVVVVCTFVGIQPVSAVKDTITNYIQQINTGTSKSKVVTIGRIFVGVPPAPFNLPLTALGQNITVGLTPTADTRPFFQYTVELYEKGNFRAKTFVSWNQPQVNAQTTLYVNFPTTTQEYQAYAGQDVSKIFSVKVY